MPSYFISLFITTILWQNPFIRNIIFIRNYDCLETDPGCFYKVNRRFKKPVRSFDNFVGQEVESIVKRCMKRLSYFFKKEHLAPVFSPQKSLSTPRRRTIPIAKQLRCIYKFTLTSARQTTHFSIVRSNTTRLVSARQ